MVQLGIGDRRGRGKQCSHTQRDASVDLQLGFLHGSLGTAIPGNCLKLSTIREQYPLARKYRFRKRNDVMTQGAEQIDFPGLDEPDNRRDQRRFPTLEPAELAAPAEGRLESMGIRLTQSSIQEEPTDFRARPERGDAVARLTVYALNACILVIAFPVGFGLLIFNILGGENLRTTAHTMALTGLGTAIGSAGVVADLLGLI